MAGAKKTASRARTSGTAASQAPPARDSLPSGGADLVAVLDAQTRYLEALHARLEKNEAQLLGFANATWERLNNREAELDGRAQRLDRIQAWLNQKIPGGIDAAETQMAEEQGVDPQAVLDALASGQSPYG